MNKRNLTFVAIVLSLSLLSISACEKTTVNSLTIGDKYINLSLPDTSGNIVSISNYDGSYRLIEFWASWCLPSREENLNLPAIYNQYKDKNFVIYGVSLDTKSSVWKRAIVSDNLNWPNVTDLQGWDSEIIELYGVTYTPYNVLVDPDGFIIGRNLKGEALAERLGELLD